MPVTSVPKTHQELTAFAKETLTNLINKYNADNQRFIDDGKPTPGLIYSCSGAVSLLLLVNSFDELGEKEVVQQIVLKEFDKVYAYIAQKGFDATPLVADTLTKMFSPQASPRYYYMDSVSWVLGLALHTRLAIRNKNFTFETDEAKREVLDRVYELTRTSLEIICDSMCPQGGWNFSNGCTKPHLYYSYAVAEALADFGDYALGETPEIFGESTQEKAKDNDLLKFLGDDLVQRVEGSRKKMGEWLKDNYLSDLGSKEVSPEGQQEGHILLYYSYFVLDMLIICKTDEFFADWADRINKGVEHGIYLSRINFDRAYTDKDWFDNPDKSSLRLNWEDHENPSLIPKRDLKLDEPGLVPLSVRCNALYAYYIANGEDRKMYDLFSILFNNRHEETGLWDFYSYNLMVTERAVEAIVDYNDYLLKFESQLPQPSATTDQDSKFESGFRTLVRDAVTDYLRSPEGGEQVRALPSAANGSDGLAALDENRLLFLMTSALAIGERYMSNGKEDPSLLNGETFKKFRSRFSDFLITLLVERLKSTVKDSSKHEKLRAAVNHNSKRLFDQLGPWLSESPKVDMGAVFDYLIHEAVKDLGMQVVDVPKKNPS